MSTFGLPRPIIDVPWRSPWRLDLERWMREPAPRRARFVAAPRAKVLRPVSRRRAPIPRRPCSYACGRTINAGNKTGACFKCSNAHQREIKLGPRPLCACGATMNRTNRNGICKTCYNKNRRWLKSGGRPKCSFPGCLEILARDNVRKLCGWHNPEQKHKPRYRDTKPRMEA